MLPFATVSVLPLLLLSVARDIAQPHRIEAVGVAGETIDRNAEVERDRLAGRSRHRSGRYRRRQRVDRDRLAGPCAGIIARVVYLQIGRAACRESVWISIEAVPFQANDIDRCVT